MFESAVTGAVHNQGVSELKEGWDFFLVANLEQQSPYQPHLKRAAVDCEYFCVNLDVSFSSLPKTRHLLLEEA